MKITSLGKNQINGGGEISLLEGSNGSGTSRTLISMGDIRSELADANRA